MNLGASEHLVDNANPNITQTKVFDLFSTLKYTIYGITLYQNEILQKINTNFSLSQSCHLSDPLC